MISFLPLWRYPLAVNVKFVQLCMASLLSKVLVTTID